MKSRTGFIRVVLIAVGIFTALRAFPAELSKQCTDDVGGKNIKIVLAIGNDGKVYDFWPYKTPLPFVTFPLAVETIENAPSVITITPYRVNPVIQLVCWTNPMTGKYQCK